MIDAQACNVSQRIALCFREEEEQIYFRIFFQGVFEFAVDFSIFLDFCTLFFSILITLPSDGFPKVTTEHRMA